jgi:hypothetical protein
MNWSAMLFLFGFSFVKFLVMPFSGPILKLSFFETYMSCVAGGTISSAIFYFSAGYFMRTAREKKARKQKEMLAMGATVVHKRKFTRMNKFIVRIKRSLGIIGTCFWAPFFLSVPIGSIIAAKFYGHQKITYPLIVLGMLINAVLTTGAAYLIYG